MIESKMRELECSQGPPYYKSMGILPGPQGHLTPQSLVRSGRILTSSEMLCVVSLPTSMKNIRSKMKVLECSQHFPRYNPSRSYLLSRKPEFQSYLVQNLIQAIPHPNDASDKIWLNLACCLRRYSCLKVWTHRLTDRHTEGQTPARMVYYKLDLYTISSPMSLRLRWDKIVDGRTDRRQSATISYLYNEPLAQMG